MRGWLETAGILALVLVLLAFAGASMATPFIVAFAAFVWTLRALGLIA